MNRAIFIVVLASFTACTTSKPIYLPDGRQGIAIDCSDNGGWTAAGWNECAKRAGELCKSRGYDVVNQNAEQKSSFGGSAYGVAGGTSSQRQMIVACK